VPEGHPLGHSSCVLYLGREDSGGVPSRWGERERRDREPSHAGTRALPPGDQAEMNGTVLASRKEARPPGADGMEPAVGWRRGKRCSHVGAVDSPSLAGAGAPHNAPVFTCPRQPRRRITADGENGRGLG
jgi:hypothetical protein